MASRGTHAGATVRVRPWPQADSCWGLRRWLAACVALPWSVERECVCVSVCLCVYACAGLGCGGQRDSRRTVGDCGGTGAAWLLAVFAGVTEWQGVVPRAQSLDCVRRHSLGRAQRFPRVAAAGVRGGGPCVRLGCLGRAERPGRLPKVFVQASHGSGAKKMAGLPNFRGAGERREEWAYCQPGPRLSTDPGRRRRARPPSKLSSAQTFWPPLPGLPCGRPDGPGESRPTAQRREGHRQQWTPPTVLRPRRRVSREQNSADLGAL